jgi:phosphoglycerate dehydrogenase-like enzyme
MSGKTLVVLGYGDIGRAVAQRAVAFDMHIIGIKRRVEASSDEYASEIYPISELHSVLPRADYLAMALPLVADTINLIGAAELAMMPKTSFLINLGRGDSLDEDALNEALRADTIAGAALDVFKKEPLPDTSPLWTAPNCLISPHNAD